MKKEKKEFIDFKNIKEIIKYSTENYAENTAFTIKNKTGKNTEYKKITYKQLNEDINALGTALLKLGLKGKRIAIIGKNRYEWILSYITTLNGVGIAVPLDKGLPEQEIILSVQRSKADVIIFEENMEDENSINPLKNEEILEKSKKRKII